MKSSRHQPNSASAATPRKATFEEIDSRPRSDDFHRKHSNLISTTTVGRGAETSFVDSNASAWRISHRNTRKKSKTSRENAKPTCDDAKPTRDDAKSTC